MRRTRKKVLYVVVSYDADQSALDDIDHAHSKRAAIKTATEQARQAGVASVTVFKAVMEAKAEPARIDITEPYE
jgi:hypothetical protein